MPEGRRFQVECHGYMVGLDVCEVLHVDVHKAENGVGEYSLFVGKQLDTVECAVEDAVSVDCEKSHIYLPVKK